MCENGKPSVLCGRWKMCEKRKLSTTCGQWKMCEKGKRSTNEKRVKREKSGENMEQKTHESEKNRERQENDIREKEGQKGQKRQEPFFTKEKSFYQVFFRMMIVVALQNLVAYSVNMLDNIMLGSYSQTALSGAATVNQVFFVVNQLALAIGNSLVAIASQYWGKKETEPIKRITGIALTFSLVTAGIILVICGLFPRQLLGLFTTSSEIIEAGVIYLSLLKWTFLLFLISNLLIAMLRSVETVQISFVVSVVSLLINGIINYTLIFGHFGFPEMGIKGAAIGTLTARIVELLIVIVYVARIDQKVKLFDRRFLYNIFAKENRVLWGRFVKVSAPIIFASLIWALSLPMQTAILGHLSSDAIAANSVSSTFFQYLKVIVVAISSSSAVMIGKRIGSGDESKVRSDARTLCVIDVCIGIILGILLFLLRTPLLSMYNLTPQATIYADHFIIIMSFIMVGMSYQMPVSVGIIQGSGDTKFNMYMNMISTWGIVMPLSFLAAFVWKLPVELVVVAVQSDQIFKGIPVFLRFRGYKWIHHLTK